MIVLTSSKLPTSGDPMSFPVVKSWQPTYNCYVNSLNITATIFHWYFCMISILEFSHFQKPLHFMYYTVNRIIQPTTTQTVNEVTAESRLLFNFAQALSPRSLLKHHSTFLCGEEHNHQKLSKTYFYVTEVYKYQSFQNIMRSYNFPTNTEIGFIVEQRAMVELGHYIWDARCGQLSDIMFSPNILCYVQVQGINIMKVLWRWQC